MSINPGTRIACVMVGLPAVGKTMISQKVCRYLQWLGINTKVFNVGNYRRKLHGAHQPHDFFDPANQDGERSRREAAVEALNDMVYWFKKEDGVVALYDATNSTRARRQLLLAACKKHGIEVMFIESICQDESLVLNNIMDVKLSSPDYKNMDPEQAVVDFRARIAHYEEAYETITENNLTYIKLINVGSQVIINHIQGYLQSRIVYYLMNLHIAPRSIFFSRHGESLYNVMGKLGGDSELSPRGRQYAKSLPLLITRHLGNSEQLTVWTSTMKRTIATAQHLTYPKLQWKALDELDAGVCDGMTYEEIEEVYPEDFANRDEDKFNYRYRGGESYRDVVLRLEPIIMDLERQRNILIIGHQAILRCIYAYFMNYSHEKLPYIKIPLHTVIQLTPKAYTCEEKRFKVDIEAVDTHRPKPKHGADPVAAEAGVAGAPAADALTKPASDSSSKSGDKEVEAKITTTTMSTTTFRDGAIPPRSRATSRAAIEHATRAVMGESELAFEKAKVLQSALLEANGTTSVANPTVALNLDNIRTPVPEQGPEGGVGCESGKTSLEGVSTPPMSPVPSSSGSKGASESVEDLASSKSGTEMANGSSSPVPGLSQEASEEKDAPVALVNQLSIKTENLIATPPSIARVKSETLPTALGWQEGPEYELTAGGSPREPLMSPGGRILPKTENWHFP